MPPRGRTMSPGPRARAGASPAPAASPKPAAKRAAAAAPTGFFSRHGNVYIYVPNLIGALRWDARPRAAACGACSARGARHARKREAAAAALANPNRVGSLSHVPSARASSCAPQPAPRACTHARCALRTRR